MKPYRIGGICLLSTLLILALWTGVSGAETASAWKAEAELGYLMTSGNTDTQSLNAGSNLTYDGDRWKHALTGNVVYSSEKSSATGTNQTTAQKYRISGQSNFKFDDRNSAFGLVTYDNDRFSGYKDQLSFVVGYARQLIKTDRVDLLVEAGPGYRISRLRPTPPAVSGATEKEAIFRAAGAFKYKISKTATFSQTVSVESGSKNTATRSVTALKSQINGSLAMKVSYTLKNNSSVPAGTHKTDTETALALVYSF